LKLSDIDRAIADEEARIMKAQARLVALRALREVLHSEQGTNTVPNMQAATESARRSRPGRPLTAKHPFPVALEAKGSTVTAWAKRHRLDRAVVKAWFAKGDGGRRIPRDMADKIEAELGVPATLAIWKNGIR